MKNPFSGKYTLTQDWDTHLANAGPTLGGEDYGMKVGTPLPVVPGVPMWITPATTPRPPWYNTGLGWVGFYARPDGSGTAYGHCSGRDAAGVFLSGGAKGAPGSGNSRGPHVHVMDIAPDGRTRAHPFTTINETEFPMIAIAPLVKDGKVVGYSIVGVSGKRADIDSGTGELVLRLISNGPGGMLGAQIDTAAGAIRRVAPDADAAVDLEALADLIAARIKFPTTISGHLTL